MSGKEQEHTALLSMAHIEQIVCYLAEDSDSTTTSTYPWPGMHQCFLPSSFSAPQTVQYMVVHWVLGHTTVALFPTRSLGTSALKGM